MDEAVVDTERAAEPIEFGSIIANKYTILRPDNAGTPTSFICREAQSDALRSVWAHRPRHDLDPTGEKFRQELMRVAKLEHPQLRKVLDCGRDENGILYAAYEPVELRNLSDVLDQDWPLGDERVVWLTCQLLAALEVAHAAGLSHGDLRPENILVRAAGSVSQNEEILLCGLGLANSARQPFSARPPRSRLQLADWMVGTPFYAAPEQMRGEPNDARSDVYATGLLLFQLLTRTQPFVATNDHDTAWMQCFTPPPPPSGYGRVTPALEAICLKALTKTPDMRYQSANEMRAALLESQVVRSSRISRTAPRPSRTSTRPARESAPPAVVVATRISEPSPALARIDTITVEAQDRSSVPPVPAPAAQAPGKRGRSTTWLLVCCTLAVTAATVLPDLRELRDGEAESEVTALSDLRDGFRKNTTGALAAEAPVEAVPAPSPPAAVPTAVSSSLPPTAAAAPSIAEALESTASSEAPAAPAAGARSPIAAEAKPGESAKPIPRVAPRVRVRAFEKSVVAADATAHDNAIPAPQTIAMAVAAALEPALPGGAGPVDPESTSALLSPVASGTAAEHLAAVAHPTLPPNMPPPVTASDMPPQPIVLTSAPRSDAARSPSAAAKEVEVVIGEAVAEHGAVSKAALRNALNHSALARCYLESIRSGESPARSLQTSLEIDTNLTGRIVSAKVAGGAMPDGLQRCVETAARLGRVREADTGEVRARFDVRFQVR